MYTPTNQNTTGILSLPSAKGGTDVLLVTEEIVTLGDVGNFDKAAANASTFFGFLVSLGRSIDNATQANTKAKEEGLIHNPASTDEGAQDTLYSGQNPIAPGQKMTTTKPKE